MIKILRKKSNYSQSDLAKILNVHQTAVSQWEQGRTFPDTVLLKKIADLFEVSVDYLLGFSEEDTSKKDSVLTIPVYGKIPAGIPMEAIEDIEDYEEAPASWSKGGKEFFALKIKGDSMLPEYRENDVIIFKKQPICESGEDCAVLVNGDESTFKRVVRQENGIILKPLNPDYEARFYSNDDIEKLPIIVLGTFWEMRRSRNN